MKGLGGFLMLMFLFFCFVWGIGSVVAAIKNIFGTNERGAPSKHTHFDGMKTADGVEEDMFERLRKAGQLHKDGTLSDQEFYRLKEKIINNI